MQQHDFVHAIADLREQCIGLRNFLLRAADAHEQVVDCSDQRGEFGMIGVEIDATTQSPTDRD